MEGFTWCLFQGISRQKKSLNFVKNITCWSIQKLKEWNSNTCFCWVYYSYFIISVQKFNGNGHIYNIIHSVTFFYLRGSYLKSIFDLHLVLREQMNAFLLWVLEYAIRSSNRMLSHLTIRCKDAFKSFVKIHERRNFVPWICCNIWTFFTIHWNFFRWSHLRDNYTKYLLPIHR